MHVRPIARLAALILAAALSAGPARAEAPPDVVASVKPVHSLVAAVMEGVGEPHLLVRGAANPHAFSLKPSDARALEGAELVFWMGPTLETFLERPLAALGADARTVALLEAPGLNRRPTRAAGAWASGHDHAHGAAEHGIGEQGAAEVALGGVDGHAWLDPRNAGAMADAILAALVEADPARAERYRANAARLSARLAELDAELERTLAPVRQRPFVVFHDAYHYLEDRYGLNGVGALTVSPDRPPGAARLGEIRARIRGLGAACVFAEPQFEPALVDTVVAGTEARRGVLDPEGAALPDGPELYFSLMRANARALADCLGG